MIRHAAGPGPGVGLDRVAPVAETEMAAIADPTILGADKFVKLEPG